VRPSFNYDSKEWRVLKAYLDEEITKIQGGFENYKDWETTMRYQERIKVLKSIRNMESAGDAQD